MINYILHILHLRSFLLGLILLISYEMTTHVRSSIYTYLIMYQGIESLVLPLLFWRTVEVSEDESLLLQAVLPLWRWMSKQYCNHRNENKCTQWPSLSLKTTAVWAIINTCKNMLRVIPWENGKHILPKRKSIKNQSQRTNGPVNAHLISWPSKAQNIQNLENIW